MILTKRYGECLNAECQCRCSVQRALKLKRLVTSDLSPIRNGMLIVAPETAVSLFKSHQIPQGVFSHHQIHPLPFSHSVPPYHTRLNHTLHRD